MTNPFNNLTTMSADPPDYYYNKTVSTIYYPTKSLANSFALMFSKAVKVEQLMVKTSPKKTIAV